MATQPTADGLSDWSVIDPPGEHAEASKQGEDQSVGKPDIPEPVPQGRHATRVSPQNSLLQELLAIVTMLCIFGWIWIAPVLALTCCWYIVVHGSKVGLAVFIVLASMAIWPAHPYWPAFVHSSIWDCWRRYFQYSYITPPLPYRSPDKHTLYVHFPHGSFPMGSWLSVGATQHEDSGMPERVYAFGASLLLALPVVRHIMSWMGVVPADKQVMLDVLSKASGGALPEGIAGIFTGASRLLLSPLPVHSATMLVMVPLLQGDFAAMEHVRQQERIYLSKRKGFVKVALQAGADLVPVYILGQSQVFVYKGAEALSRQFRCAIGFFYGRWYSPVPSKVKLTVLVGKPITITRVDDPDQKQIEQLHQQVVEEVKNLYYTHRHLHGWQNRELEVV